MRVGWFLQSRSVDVASVRYRCYHMAWGLHGLGVASSIYLDPGAIQKDFPNLDALIVVKRMNAPVLSVVTAAAEAGKPIIFDICDDVLMPGYLATSRHLHQSLFRGIAPLLDSVVTTGSAMADRIRGYGFDVPEILEIPDVAETAETLSEVAAYATWLENPAAAPAPGKLPTLVGKRAPADRPPGTPFRIVWFGNHGVPHSNFGMLSLLGAGPALRSVHAEQPLELTIISNHQPKFDTFLTRLGIPVRYVPWTAKGVYDELARSDVALLTNGDDEFSAVKSGNRALQALACGVPVIATSNAALRELSGCIVLDDVAGGLRLYINDPAAARSAIGAGKAIIAERYSTEAAGRRWLDLLSKQVRAPRRAATAAVRAPAEPRVLFLIDAAGDLARLGPLIDEAAKRAIDIMLVVTANAGQESPELVDFLVSRSLIPTMAASEEIESGDVRWLRDADAVIVAVESAAPEHRAARALAALARRHDIAVVTLTTATPDAEATASPGISCGGGRLVPSAAAVIDAVLDRIDKNGDAV